MVALVALLGAGCAPDGGVRPSGPNVLLITADTLRADHLGAYGPSPASTPALDRLAAEGLVFDNAAAPMPVTKPSHFSIFTGHPPRRHGVVNNQLALPDAARTLAEGFSEAGYRTAGFPAVRFFGRSSGAAQGFGYYAPAESRPYDPAGVVVERVLTWTRSLPEGEPFFVWLHLFDPHTPYAPPPRHRPREPAPADGLADEVTWGTVRRSARTTGGDLTPAALARARALYAGEVELLDHAVGRLLDDLRGRDLLDGTVVAFTADHGECFEQGFYFRHADCLYDGAIRVPLVLRHPAGLGAPGRVERPVELASLGRTLFELAGVAPPEGFGGGSLLAEDEGVEYAFFQPILSDGGAADAREGKWGRVASIAGDPMAPVLRSPDPAGLRGSRFKYVLYEPRREVLYDLRSAEGEGKDVAARHPEVLREMRRHLRRLLKEQPVEVLDPGAISKELRESLEALGYL
ncbi:MAG: sulfatase [Acidobacteriota bacterium]